MAKIRKRKKEQDIFEEANLLQDKLMLMYEDRKIKGYKSLYKLSDIKSLEVEINSLNDKLLSEEYDLEEFLKLRDSQIKSIEVQSKLEEDLMQQLEQARKSLRLATLRKQSLTKIIEDNEGKGYLTDLGTKSLLDDMDITDFDMSSFCLDFHIELPNLSDDDFVLKMFSFFRSNEAFKHYSEGDLAVLFRRNFVIDKKRLTFVSIKEQFYPDGKTPDTYSKLYKIIRDKFRKHIKLHPNDLRF